MRDLFMISEFKTDNSACMLRSKSNVFITGC
jgi:hypothetical protein